MSAPVLLKCQTCGGGLPQAPFGQRYLKCMFCGASYDAGAPPPVPVTPFGGGGPASGYAPATHSYPRVVVVQTGGARIAMYVLPIAFVMLSLGASMVAQCNSEQRAQEAAAAAQAQASRAQAARAPIVAATTKPPGTAVTYHVGDKVTVDWKGSQYAAIVVAVVGPRYKIHYDGWGKEWDEVVDAPRILSKR